MEDGVDEDGGRARMLLEEKGIGIMWENALLPGAQALPCLRSQ